MRTHFYIVRHGQTLFNTKDLYQGWADSPLMEKGIKQANALHEGLKDIDFTYAVSSSSERAMDTMAYILEGRDVENTYDKGLREIFFGMKEGEHWPSTKPAFEIDWKGYAYCGGEDREEAYLRFKNTLEKYAKGGNVLIVSHGAVIARMIQHLDPETWEKKQSPGEFVFNCSVTRVDYEDGKFTLVAHPDTSYWEKYI